MTDYERLDYEMNDRKNWGIALTFLFIGLGIGAVSTMMLAPKSGKQMRKSLRRRYEDAVDTFGEWRENAGGVLERGANMAGTARDFARDKVRPFAKAMRRGE